MKNKELLAGALSLSCVENYFLAWLSKNAISPSLLFHKSFINFYRLLEDFLLGNARYETYEKLPRVQRLAEEAGMVSRRYSNMAAISGINDFSSLTMVRVTPDFFAKQSLVPWREDHYIWLTGKSEEGYTYLNNYPLSEGELSCARLAEFFDRTLLTYKLSGHIDYENIRENCIDQINRIIASQRVEGKIPDLETANLRGLRDAVGILKITRKRLLNWVPLLMGCGLLVSDYAICTHLQEEAALLEKLHLSLEAQRLRARYDFKKLESGLMEIARYENRLPALFKEKRIIDERTKYH